MNSYILFFSFTFYLLAQKPCVFFKKSFTKSKIYGKIVFKREALKMSESRWAFSKWLRQGEQIGRDERGKETAHEMFLECENIVKIRKYSKLQDDDLADILRGLPTDIQRKYDLLPN